MKGLLKQFHDFLPQKKGGQQSNNDNFFTRPSGNRKADSPTTWLEDFRATKLPRRRCVLLRRPRFRSPPGRNGWMKEPKTGSFRTVSRWRMIKDTQLAWFLHGKAIPQCHPGGHGLVPLLGQGSSTWCQKLAFLDSSPYPAATPGLYMPVPPTSHLTLVPDFNACFYQIF